MQSKIIIQIFTLIWCFNPKVCSTAAAQNPIEHKENQTNFLLTRILAAGNVSNNFLIAPQEIIKLYENDYENTNVSIDDMQQQQQNHEEEENHFDNPEREEEFFSERQRSSVPIIVTNSLLEENGGNADDFRTSTNSSATTTGNHSRLHLINAITLKSRWAFNFQKRDTHKHLFYTTPQSHVYVDSMIKDDMFPYASLEHLNATALELALHQHHYDELKLLILLPNDVEGLPQLQRQLCMNLSLIDDIVEQYLLPTFVRLFIPKFQISFNIELSQVFKELAKTNKVHKVVLNSNISSVFQKTHIELNEDGIGDLERRFVLFWNAYSSLRTTPVFFDVNHPFIFIIRNKKDIKFFGHLTEL